MANSPLLGIPLVSSNQSNKETTISDGFVILEKSLNDALAISAASGDVVLADLDFKRYMVFKVSGHTVNRSVTIINSKRLFMVHNKGTGILTIKTAASTTNPTIAGGSVGIFLCDGAGGILKIADSAAAILVQHLINLNDTPNSYIGQSGKVLAVKLTEDGVEFVSTDKTLAELTDGPGGYDDANLKYLRIKADGTGFEFVSANPGGETEFILLNDVPSSYAGQGGYFLRVKSTADGLEFVAPNNAINFTQLKDAPHSLSGQANKAVFVKSDETGLVFSDLPDPAVYTTVLVDDANLDFDTGSLTGWAITAGDPAKHVVGTLIDGKSPAGGTYLYAFYDETANVGEITRTIDLTAYGTGTELDSDAKVIFGLNYQSLDPTSSGMVTFDMCASSGAVLRTETFDDLSAQDAWAAVTRTFSIPAGTRTVIIRVHSEGTGTGAFMAWDSFALSLRLKQPQDFLGLTDTPDSYTGNVGKLVRVKTGGGLEFTTVKATELSDVPDTLTGQAGKLLAVNSAEGGFELVARPSGTLPDMVGKAGKLLAVKTDETGAEWIPTPIALPAGGAVGQVLTKIGGSDGQAGWADPTGGSGEGSGASYKGEWGLEPGTRTIDFENGMAPDLVVDNPAYMISAQPDTDVNLLKAFRFADIGANQSSTLTYNFITPPGGGTLSFRYKVSSEYADPFKATIDTTEVVSHAGVDTVYNEYSTSLAAGAHSLKLKYAKDFRDDVGDDTVYISRIVAQAMIPASYVAGDTVTYNGNVFLCLVTGTQQTPGVGSDWRQIGGSVGLPYVASLYAAGKTDNAETLLYHPVALAMTIPASGAGTYAKAATAAGSTAVFTLQKNGTSFGTLTFASGANTATVAITADTAFVAGDVLSLAGPTVADSLLANIGFTISGTRN